MYGTIETVRDVPKLKLKRDHVYTFARTAALSPVSVSTTLDQSMGYTFNLASVPNSADFINTFDQYKIAQVRFKIVCTQYSSQAPVYTALDYDDAGTPTLANMLEKDTLRISNSAIVTERVFNPRVLQEVYNSPTTSGYATVISPWLDTANSGVPHYGLKLYLPAILAGTNSFSITAEFIISCRSPS